MGADSHLRMPAELVLERRERALLLTTLVQMDILIARAVWRGVQPLHHVAVRPAGLGPAFRGTGRW
jgi:hypothetical protein